MLPRLHRGHGEGCILKLFAGAVDERGGVGGGSHVEAHPQADAAAAAAGCHSVPANHDVVAGQRAGAADNNGSPARVVAGPAVRGAGRRAVLRWGT